MNQYETEIRPRRIIVTVQCECGERLKPVHGLTKTINYAGSHDRVNEQITVQSHVCEIPEDDET